MESLRIPVLNSDAWTPKTSSEPIGIHARVRVKSSIRLRQVQIIKRKLSFSCLLLRLNLPTSGACLGSGRSRRGLSAASRGDPNKSAFSRPRLAPWNVPAPPECLLFTPHLLLDASSRFSGLAQRFRVCYKYPAFMQKIPGILHFPAVLADMFELKKTHKRQRSLILDFFSPAEPAQP